MSKRDEIEATDSRQARDAFSSHVITRRSVDEAGDDTSWWRLRRPDGGSQFSCEIISGAHGALIVHGDIDAMCFQFGPKPPKSRVCWMGLNDLDHYVIEKASIGFGRELLKVWDADVAREDVAGVIESYKEDGADEELLTKLRSVLEGVTGSSTQPEVLGELYEAGCDAEDLSGIGEVVSTRLVYAHAAVARLATLLREEGASC